MASNEPLRIAGGPNLWDLLIQGLANRRAVDFTFFYNSDRGPHGHRAMTSVKSVEVLTVCEPRNEDESSSTYMVGLVIDPDPITWQMVLGEVTYFVYDTKLRTGFEVAEGSVWICIRCERRSVIRRDSASNPPYQCWECGHKYTGTEL